MNADELQNLREAVKSSPDNIPLRKYLANSLYKAKRYEEAEIEYKDALRLSANDTSLKLGLVRCFCKREKTSLGLVIVEEILQMPTPPPEAWLLYAKLLMQTNNPSEAKEAYEKAIILDDGLKDTFLESQINLKKAAGASPEPEKIQLGGQDWQGDDEKSVEIERPKTTFDEVGGMDKVKEEIRMKIIHPLAHPEIYKAYGKKIGGGILMYGPPGCGKTHLARATAGEVNANFISVGISEILDMYMGQSERNLHAIFEKARNLKPCVLFFDEVDALGANRSDMRQSVGRNIINQFLAELDGIEYDNDGVLILAATNTPWHLDPAFRRPGRFDRIIFVPPPDDAARASILKIKLEGKPAETINYEKITKKTKDFSGADIDAIIDIAIESKLDESIRQGKAVPINTKDIERAASRHKASTKEWFNTAKNYALFSNEAGLYDDILDFLNIKK